MFPMNVSSGHIILHMSLIAGIGPATIRQVIESVGVQALDKIYNFSASDFMALQISYDRAVKLAAGLQDHALLATELDLIKKHNISWTFFGAHDYCPSLMHIEQPPVVLYYQGVNLLTEEKKIAFVGSRKADAYARVVVEKLVPPLVAQDWAIVSGGALGVDSFVHQQVAKLGGKTIVVLGSGLLHWYPMCNRYLFEDVIAAGGMVLSAFSLQTRPIAANFPARNRIIAGLSQGTVVVQAALKSGALITADFALEQGRTIFAVPGSIEHGLHDGCHHLIQQGAKLVVQVSDILEEFGGGIQTKNVDPDVQIQLPLALATSESCDPQEIAILQYLLQAKSVEDIGLHLDLSLEDLMQKLFDLSLAGKIEQDMMGLWKRI